MTISKELLDELLSGIERFFLWNDCRPMRASAYLWSDDVNCRVTPRTRSYQIGGAQTCAQL